ncbi:hypothetical protein N825_10270 [Skermanella stibiiresistens SB22]|uniref:MEDS domain-containing protein n=1 Tax=Skermanella stibiiresistens SB22 TaxID=1385369 RepID=W9H5B5_9PROT|nr:MEDS domain-containing protein [Skermanella stibiiresistens]EWY38953.1 hypothetical protein N825_10270 [Skermanella stibiiresistens SB22]
MALLDAGQRRISVGAWNERVMSGVHICQFFADEDERLGAVTGFLASGLGDGDKCVCCSDNVPISALGSHLSSVGLSLEMACATGQLSIAATSDLCFSANRFDPEHMVGAMRDHGVSAARDGWAGTRIVSEINPTVFGWDGGGRLIEFEAAVDDLVGETGVTALCQYDVRRFDGAILMEVLRLHPMVMIRGVVLRNPLHGGGSAVAVPGAASREVSGGVAGTDA